MLIVISMVLSSMAFTLPVSATDPEAVVGEVLWSENFDDVNIETIAEDHSDWIGTVVHPNPENTNTVLTKTTSNGSLTWADAEDVYTGRISFADDKLTLSESTSTYHGGALAKLQMNITPTRTPTNGYTVLEFDYSSDAMAVRNRFNETGNVDVLLTGQGDGRTYGELSITQTNGVQDLFATSGIGSSDGYTNIVAGTHKDNIMSTEGYDGETIHVAYIFDIANLRYMVSATRNGEKAFRSSEWFQYEAANTGVAPSASWFVKRITLTMAESPEVPGDFSTASYDNLTYTYYSALPQIATSSITDGEENVPRAEGTISLTFDTRLDEASFGGITLAPTAGGDAVAITPELNGLAGIDIDYSGLAANTQYTLTVPKTVTSENGLPLAAAATYTFTTDAPAVMTNPTVESVSPADEATSISTGANVEITFSEEIANYAGITLTAGSDEVEVEKSLSADKLTVTLDPVDALANDTVYTVTVPTSVTAVNGGTVQDEFTSTFETEEVTGTVLWSENFDGLTAGRDGWTASVGNYSGGALTTKTVDGTTVTWEMAANDYTSKLAFVDGKLVLGQKRNTEHGSETASLTMPFSYNTTHPTTGYTILEYDYYSNALPIRNRYNERNTASDLVLNQKNGSGRTYGKLDITSTNGIQDMLGAGTISNADAYNTIAAGTHKENIRTASDISGKTVHMALIFDVANTQYNIAAFVDGEYSFLSSDWVDLPSNAHPQQFFDRVILTQSECNTEADEWTEVSYDNFTYTAFPTLPAWAVAPEAVVPVVSSTTPANNAEDVDVDQAIAVAFNVEMDAESLDNIKLYKDAVDEANAIALVKEVAADKKSVTFTHETLENETDYILVIPVTVISDDDVALEEEVTVTFTTEAFDPVLWSEDFTTLPEGVTANTSVSSWYTDGWSSEIQASGYVEGMNEFKFVDGKLQMTKGQNEATKGKGVIAKKTIAGAPATGVVTLDFDFTLSGKYAADAYSPAMAILNEAGQQLLAFNVGGGYSGLCINAINSAAGSVVMGTAPLNGSPVTNGTFANSTTPDKLAALTDGNGTIHVRIAIDLDDKVYSAVLTKGGVEYTTNTTYFAIDEDITDVKIATVAFQANNATVSDNYTDTPIVTTFDNIVLRVADAVAPTIENCTVTDGDDDASPNEPIEIEFSTEIDEDSIAGITLVKTVGGEAVDFTPVLAANGKTVVLDYDTLAYGTQYTLTVPVTVESLTDVALAAPVTYTFTTGDVTGTVIWSENFDGLTAGRDGWTASVGNYVGGALTTKTVDGTTVTWEMAANDYTSKIAFTDGKLVLGQKRNTEHGSETASLSIPFGLDTATGRPAATGYLIMEYDYASNALPIRNRYNERNTASDLSLVESASNRQYAKIDITSTNGIQSMLGAGAISNADDYTNIAAGTHKDNVRTASDLSGKTVHMALIFDVVNTQYNVAALVDGEYSFLSPTWVDYTGNQHASWFFNKITLTQSECNPGLDEWTEVSYDNFVLTQYATLPSWAIVDAPAVGTITPADAAEDVAVDADITVTFDKAVKAESLANIKLYKESVDGEEVALTKTVAADNKSVTFTHADLDNETVYVLVVPRTVVGANNVALAAKETVTFTTEEEAAIVTPDPVTATIVPEDEAIDVAIDANIVVTFSRPIKDTTIDGITVMAGATPVDFATSVDGAVLTINPDADLAYETVYTVTLPATIKATDDGAFAGLTSTFTTVDEPAVVIPAPTVLSRNPDDGDTDVAVDTDIVITFDKPMNEGTLDFIEIRNGATVVTYQKAVAGNTVTITPDQALEDGTTYTVTIPSTVLAADGGVFVEETYTFTTESEEVVTPDPVTATIVPEDAATGVAIDANIVVTFSRPIKDTTIDGITLKAGDLPVTFATSVDGAVLTINPDSDLANGTTYTVTLPATIVATDDGAFAGLTSTFTTVAAVLPDPDPTPSEGTELWSQDFDAMSDLSGAALDAYMAENYSGWSAQIGTAPTQYTATNYSLGTGFTWSEGMTKYVTNDNKGGLVGFANGRVKLGVPSYMGHGSTETKVTIPVSIADMTDVNYAVFEFDYYSDKIAKRGGNQNFNSGNVLLQNASGKNIARISIGTAWGIQDLADLATLNATTIGAVANNLGTASSALHGKTIHFAVVFDMDNDKYTIAVTPEGGDTTVRMNETTPWISLPDGVTADSFAKIVLSEKDYLAASGISSSEYGNFKITGYEALPSVVSSSIANGATGIPTDGSIVLTFSDEIDENTIGGITFKQGATSIDIAPVVDGTTVTVPYDALAGFTTYTLTVPATVSNVDGLPIAPEYVLTFTTGERIAPTPVVSEINPADEDTEVSIYSDIVIEFSVPMAVDTLDDILLKNEAGEAITYTYEMSNNDKVMTITPDEALAVLSDYTVVIPVSVISAEDKPLAEEVTATFTTADYPLTTGSVLWEQNFDDVTSSNVPENWKGTIVVPNPENGNVTVSYSTSTNMTWADAATAYAGKIAFEGGKLQIGEKGNMEHGATGTTIEIPVELESAHPTTGYTVFEYDYYSDAMATRNRYNEWTYHDITLGGAKTIYMADVTTTTGIQTLLGVEYSSNATDYTGKIAGTYKDNIRSGAGLSGKTVHFQVVFDLDGLQYKIFAIVDGVVSTLSDEWTALPAGVTVENFVNKLTIKQYESNIGTSNFTLAQYDNFKYTAYDVLPQAMGSSVDALTNVAIDSDIVVSFNDVITELDENSITFTADGEEVEFTATLTDGGKKITITPAEDLPYSAICEIKLADNIKTESGYVMSGSTIEFITKPQPETFEATGITFKNEDGDVITSLGATEHVHVEGVFQNTTDTVQKITKIIVAYDANGKKLKSAFVTETIAANDSKTINLDLDIDGLGATTIKVFAIDSFANLTPMISTEVLN